MVSFPICHADAKLTLAFGQKHFTLYLVEGIESAYLVADTKKKKTISTSLNVMLTH